MRIANAAGRLALVTGSGLVDVQQTSGGQFSCDVQSSYDRWAELQSWAEARDVAADQLLAADELRAPVPAPRQVFGIGLNYRSHAEESHLPIPDDPLVFTKFVSCLTGPGAEVELPSDTVDWEAELVVVIGRAAHRVDTADGWQHVAGLTVGQDLSERRIQTRGPAPQFSLGKSFPGFGPIGPHVVSPDEFADPDDLAVSCELEGGEVLQKGRTSDLIFSVPDLVARLSAICPLLPGDLIFTGTPAGVGNGRTPPRFLTPGDVLVTTIEGIGQLRTTFGNTLNPARSNSPEVPR